MDKESLNFTDSCPCVVFFLYNSILTRSGFHLASIWLVGVTVRKFLGSINITDNVILPCPSSLPPSDS